MNDKFKELYGYFKSQGLTDLDESTFYSKYSSPEKSKEIYSYLKKNGMTDLDESSFNSSYFGSKKKEPTVLPSEPKKEVSSSVTAPQFRGPITSRSESSGLVKKEDIKEDGVYKYSGRKDALYKLSGGKWYVSPNGKGKFVELDDPDGKRAAILNKQAVKTDVTRPAAERLKDYEDLRDLSAKETADALGWSEEEVKKASVSDKKSSIKPVAANVVPDVKSGEMAIDVQANSLAKARLELGSNAPTEKINERAKYHDNVNVQQALKSKGYDVDINGNLDSDKTKFALDKMRAEKELDEKEESERNRFIVDINDKITDESISSGRLIEELRSNFSSKGFVFQEFGGSAMGTGKMIKVKYSIGPMMTTKEEAFRLDDPELTTKLRSFMAQSYMKSSEKREVLANDVNVNDEMARFEYMSGLVAKMAEAPQKYGNTLVSEDLFVNHMKSTYNYLRDEQTSISSRYEDLKGKIAAFNQNPTEEGREAINNEIHELSVRELQLTDKYEKARAAEGNFAKISSAYALEKAKTGGLFSGLAAQFGKGVVNLAQGKTMLQLSADIMPYVIDTVDPLTKNRLKFEGYSDEQIRDFASKELKNYMIPALNKGIVNVASLGLATQEYLEMGDRGVLEQTLGFLAESMGTALGSFVGGGVGAAGALTKLAFFSQAYNGMADQMIGPEFDALTEHEKKLISVPYGLTIGALERLGFKFTTSTSKNPVLNRLINSTIAKTFTSIPKDASIKTIERAISSNLAATMAQSGLRIFGGSLVEGTVEGLQQIDEIGIKNIANAIIGKDDQGFDFFRDIPDLTTVEGIKEAFELAAVDFGYGALGGAIMSTGENAVSAFRNKGIEAANQKKFLAMAATLTDSKLRALQDLKIQSELVSGAITQEQADERIQSMNKATEVINKIPDGLSTKSKIESFNLLMERSDLESEIQGKDEALTVVQRERIKEINTELQEISRSTDKDADVEVTQPEVVTEEGKVDQEVAKDKPSEIKAVETNDPKTYSEALNEARAEMGKEGPGLDLQVSAVSEQEAQDIVDEGGKIFMTEDGQAGAYVKKDGYMGGLFKNPLSKLKDVAKVLQQARVKAGGRFMEGYATKLEEIYVKNGFRPVARLEFNEEFAPEGWDAENSPLKGKPDVVFFAYDPDGKFAIGDGEYVADYDAAYEIAKNYSPEVAQEVDVDSEVSRLEDLLKDSDPNFQLDSEITGEAKKEVLVKEAMSKMTETDIDEMSEQAFEAEFPAPNVQTYPIEVKENSELAKKLKRMGLKDLIGKKINLVMADQLKVGEVMGKKRMGGPFFPLIDKLFGKVAWASINKSAAMSIVNGAIKSDYTVVYNMNPSAIDSNIATIETFEDLLSSLPKNKQALIFKEIKNQLSGKKFGAKTDEVQSLIKSSKDLSSFLSELNSLDVDTISAVVNNIIPSRDVTAGTNIGKLLQAEGITIESVRELNIEQFVADLPAGSLTMVLEVTDKNGNKVTKETASEAIMTPEQQEAEGLPSHSNYPIYVRGKAVAMLNETVPFWNLFKESINNINVKLAGVARKKKGDKFSSKEAVSNEMRRASMTANVSKKVSDKMNTQYSRFVAAISKSFPNVEVVASQKEFDALLNELTAKKLSTKNNKVYGAVYKGKLYLNPSLENYNTPVHEFGHIWLNTAKVANKELYNKGVSLIKGSDYEANVRSNREYQRVIKQMKTNGATDADIDNYIYEEALATAIGDKGEAFVTAAQKLDFKNWMRKLFSFIKSATGISKYTAEQLENVTLDEFIEAVSVDIMSGNELFKGSVTDMSDALQLMVNDSNSIDYIFSVARDNGISDAAIKKYLASKGFSEQEIKDAFKKQPKAPSVAKILGKAKPKTVIVNEATGLKDQLRLEARAARDAKKDTKGKQSMLIDAVRAMNKSGKIDVRQLDALLNRIKRLNLDNSKSVQEFLGYAQRVFERADYQEKLTEAMRINKRIKNAMKSDKVQASTAAVAKLFSKIDPKIVEDIDMYIEMAEKVFDSIRPATIKGVEVGTKTAVDYEQISEFADAEIERQEEYKRDQLLDMYEDIFEGVDVSELSLSEIRDIVFEVSQRPIDGMPTEKKAAYIRSFVEKMMDVYKPLAKSVINGVDPFSGETMDVNEKSAKLMAEVLEMDLGKLDIRDAIAIIEAVDNFITNGVSDGLQSVVSRYNGRVNAERLASSGLKARSTSTIGSEGGNTGFGRNWFTSIMSIKTASDLIFKGVNQASSVLKFIGFTAFENGVARSKKMWNDYIDSYQDKFSKLKPNGKSFMDAENIIERGLYAALKRTVPGNPKQQAAEFERKVKLVKDSVNVLRKHGDSKHKKMADIYESLIEKAGLNNPSTTIDDVEQRLDKMNVDAVSWWIGTWADNYSDLYDVSLNVYNTKLDRDMFYTPDKFSTLKRSRDVEQIVSEGGGFAMVNGFEYDKKSGVLMPSNKPASMESGRFLDLNFEMNNAKALKAALTDINTASSIRQISGALDSDAWMSVISDKKDRDAFRDKVDNFILRSRNKMVSSESKDFLDAVEKSSRIWASMGATRALASISQPIKQTVPLMLSTIFNAGRLDLINPLNSKETNDWINKSGRSIALRGLESQSGFEDANKLIEDAVNSGSGKRILESVERANRVALRWALAKPDIWIARSSFVSYYKQYMKNIGLDTDIDFSNPEGANQDALDYAQHMVDRQQNISENDLAGEFFSSGDSGRRIIRNVFFPFASFVMNQKSRMFSDFATLTSKEASTQDKIVSARSLGGLSVEMLTYHSIGFAIRAYAIQYIANAITGVSGDEEDEEDKEKRLKRQTQYMVGQVVKDVLSPTPLTDSPIINVSDKLLSIAQDALSIYDSDAKKALSDVNKERESNNKRKIEGVEAERWIAKYISENRFELSDFESEGGYGMYSITYQKAKDLHKSYNLAYNGEFSEEGFGGSATTKYILDKDRQVLKEMFPYVAAYNIIGFPSEIGAVQRRVESHVKKKKGLTENTYDNYNDYLKLSNKKTVNEIEEYLLRNTKSTDKHKAANRVKAKVDILRSIGAFESEAKTKKYMKLLQENDRFNELLSARASEITRK
jgi:hypothetical protein